VHHEILGKTPELVAVHAGLECGVIGEKHPGMQEGMGCGLQSTTFHSIE